MVIIDAESGVRWAKEIDTILVFVRLIGSSSQLA